MLPESVIIVSKTIETASMAPIIAPHFAASFQKFCFSIISFRIISSQSLQLAFALAQDFGFVAREIHDEMILEAVLGGFLTEKGRRAREEAQ